MSVKLKFASLLGLSLLVFVSAMWVLQWLDRREAARNASLLHRTREQQLDHWLIATGISLRNFANEGAQVAATRVRTDPTQFTLPENTEGVAAANVTGYWVVRSSGTVVQVEAAHGLGHPPVSAANITLWTAKPPTHRFFSESEAGLLEICVEPIIPQEGRSPWGWFLVARRWDENHLKVLTNLTEGRVTLDLHPAATLTSATVHTRLLPDWQGRPLRSLQVSYPQEGETIPPWPGLPGLAVFFGFGLLLLSGLALSLHRWVLRPLDLIGASLALDSAAPLAPLLAGQDEFAGTARRLEASFTQRDALKREIEERRSIATALLAAENDLRRTMDERTRLGRDLHDGVIQALYATGMGLAGIRALLPPGQNEASERLNQCRATLNEIIRDVRNFITGIEPEALRQQSFTQAVQALLEFMQSISPSTAKAEIDEHLASQLTLNQRANALHIMREAVSNALRHGAAEHIQVSFTRTPEGDAALDISDDGLGFTPGTESTNQGRGLDNLAQRAADLGAVFTLQSEPGQGARLRFVFTLPPKS